MSFDADRMLIILRHAKSDWSRPVPDLQRTIGKRGRRQAAEAGRWLASHAAPIDLVLTSPATRAKSTWEVAAAEFTEAPRVRVEDRLYTWSAADLRAVVREQDADTNRLVLVGHDPAVSESVTSLVGTPHDMVTSCLAALWVSGDWSAVGHDARVRMAAWGRPPADGLTR